MRKYSVAEIDAMRECIGWMYPSGVSYLQGERAADIENRLRTYMTNGTEPDELQKAARKSLERMATGPAWTGEGD